MDEQFHSITCGGCTLNETEEHSFVNGVCICGAEEETGPQVDATLKINHTLNLASDISVNYAVSRALLTGYNMSTVYLEVRVPEYEGNTFTGYTVYKLNPEDRGNYYYFTLEGLTAVQMNNELLAVLHGQKNGKIYMSAEDTYSVATYAYSQLNGSVAPATLKTLCADMLRYGAKAQIYKAYRTDALADGRMTAAHMAYLSDMENLTYGNFNSEFENFENPTVKWVGKALDLNSKVGVRYIVDLKNYTGKIEDLTLRVTFTDIEGIERTEIVSNIEVYNEAQKRYAFTFDGLLAAELRSVLIATIYENDVPVSNDMMYSADTYCANKPGNLGVLCKAIIAYSDSAYAYFVG